MIDLIPVHITDARGIYLYSAQIDRQGPQPQYASYAELPEPQVGFTRAWRNGIWNQIPDAQVDDLPWPIQPVPQSVSRAQGKAALIQAGLWSAVVAYVDAMTDPTEKALAEVALNDTTEWLRTSPFLNQAAITLGLTETQLDDLFRTAATIQL